MRTYTELVKLKTFEERFNYLKLEGGVGAETFGYDRYLNQVFYKSSEWKRLRDQIIIRDCGCDMALDGYDICGKIIIHHMNPLTVNDIENHSDAMINPEFLVCVSFDTHNAIHYGYLPPSKYTVIERKPNDTCPWKV